MESIYHFFIFHAYDVQKRGGSQLLFLGHLQIKRTYMKVCKEMVFPFPRLLRGRTKAEGMPGLRRRPRPRPARPSKQRCQISIATSPRRPPPLGMKEPTFSDPRKKERKKARSLMRGSEYVCDMRLSLFAGGFNGEKAGRKKGGGESPENVSPP